jgi:tetrahydromethanopterin S-methyltransferase subunit G|tara:strand:+ start:27577 stop:27858 length:282 start_codon:yes stop_codon:yes gene_type:complete
MDSNDGKARLDRIEEKIDKLADALIQIARFEEKLEAYNVYREDSWNRMNKFSEKLDNIEKQVQDNAHTVMLINKLFWVAIIAVTGAIATQVFM